MNVNIIIEKKHNFSKINEEGRKRGEKEEDLVIQDTFIRCQAKELIEKRHSCSPRSLEMFQIHDGR